MSTRSHIRDIYGGIGMAVGLLCLITLFALGNVSAEHARAVSPGRLTVGTTEVVHLDSGGQIPLALRHSHMRRPCDPHDR